MSGKITRKVTVETTRRLSTDSPNMSASNEQSSKMKKRSVFERLGTAGASYEAPEKCRTFMREGGCPYGKKCKYSHDMGHEVKRSKKEEKMYTNPNFDDYQDPEKIPERKKDKRKFLDAEKFKIEFKKDIVLKNKQTIAELYEEEVPMRKSKKDKKDKGDSSSFHSKVKKSYDDDVMIEKEGHVRNVQLKGDEKREKKSRFEGKSAEGKKDDDAVSHSKKQKKKKYQEESEEETNYKEKVDVTVSKKKKKKKEKTKYSSSSSETEDERARKKKLKKDKSKSYESEDSAGGKQKKKPKNVDHERHTDAQVVSDVKRKKKKKREKYESESDEQSNKEEMFSKSERTYVEDKVKKSSKYAEQEREQSKKKKSKSEKIKDEQRRSASWSIATESSSNESSDENIEKKSSKKSKNSQKGYKEEKRKEKDRKYEDVRVSHRKSHEGNKEMTDERKRENKNDREHFSHQQHYHTSGSQESNYEPWDRDNRPGFDDRQQSSQHGGMYGNGKGHSIYRSRYDAHNKSSEDRQQYRQYAEQQYPPEQGRYHSRGGRENYAHSGYRRGGFQGEDEGYQGGRSRDFYQGSSGFPHGNPPEEKLGHRHRGDFPSSKDIEDTEQRERKRITHRSPTERKGYDSSPKPRKRTRSPAEAEDEADANRSRNKKRKRDLQSTEKDESMERKEKKSKLDAKTESDAESSSEADQKSSGGRRGLERDKKLTHKEHREPGGHYRREDLGDDRRDRRADKGSRERGRHKIDASNERSRRERNSSRSEKRAESPSYDETHGKKVEDKRVKALRTSHGRSSPSDRSEHDASSKAQKKSSGSRGRSNMVDGKDVNLDDVYEKISDDELDFFDEENSKSQKPASLEDMDWSALAAIAPPSKRDEEDDGHSHIAKHSAINILKNIGFSSQLLSKNALEKLKKKSAEAMLLEKENKDKFDLTEYAGTGAVVLNKIRNRYHRRNLICGLTKEGSVLSMRKDINIRKELRIPPERLGNHGSLFCVPSSPADREIFLASASLYKKIPPGETESSFRIIPSLVGSVIECCS